jgi:hypothetical protein
MTKNEIQAAIETVRDNMGKLSAKDQSFAASLMASALSRRGITDKQAYWLGVLAKRATTPPPEAVKVGNVAGIIALFDKAAARLKWPAFVIAVPGVDKPVRLSIAGKDAKVPGSINVAEPGGYGKGVWYGRITRDGAFHPSPRVDNTDTLLAVTLAIQTMANDPAGTAAAYGKATGACCFCGRGLEDPRSVAVGYGPICADHYGLPH